MTTTKIDWTFRVVFHTRSGKTSRSGTNFSTWKDADEELARVTSYDFITGGHIDQYVPGIGYTLCDNDPDNE